MADEGFNGQGNAKSWRSSCPSNTLLPGGTTWAKSRLPMSLSFQKPLGSRITERKASEMGFSTLHGQFRPLMQYEVMLTVIDSRDMEKIFEASVVGTIDLIEQQRGQVAARSERPRVNVCA